MEGSGGFYIDLQKAITRDQAKKTHGKLPEGGTWFTMKGHHIYVKDGKILAGAFASDAGTAKKSSKAHITDLQVHVDKKLVAVKATKAPAKQAKADGAKGTKLSTPAPAKASKKKATVESTLGYKPASGKAKVKEAVKAQDKSRVEYNKRMKTEKKARDISAKPIVSAEIVQKDSKEREKDMASETGKKQAKALKEWGSEEKNPYLDEMWDSAPVKKLLAKPADKRSEAEIRKVAGNITEMQDKLSRNVVLRMGEKRGLELARQVNKIGNASTPSDQVIMQETDQYGDLLQTARMSMYETLHSVLSGTQNPNAKTAISAHVISRMKQSVDRGMQDLMNQMPVPEEMRPAIGAMAKGEAELSNTLGRKPSDDELADHLMNDPKFKKSPINALPKWDEKKGEFIATRKDDLAPVERLRLLRLYAGRQKASSLNENVGAEGEREIQKQDVLKDDNNSARPEDSVNTIDRAKDNKKMKSEIPKALDEMGLSSAEQRVFMAKFAEPSEDRYTKDGGMTTVEIAEKLGMKQQDVSRVFIEASKKLSEARANNHPALARLKDMFKAIYMDLMKSLYEYDLVKSLMSWGIGTDALIHEFVRIDYGSSLAELKKSLDTTEYIGSYVLTEAGEVHARIVELVLPEDNLIYKAFNDEFLQKSMFPHKGKNNYDVNKKASEYVKSNPKIKGLSESQHARAKTKSTGHTWSEQLLLKNPGSAWISWGGKKILVHSGTGEVIYDSKNDAHREQHNNSASEDKVDFHHEKEAYDDHHKNKEAETRKQWADHVRGKEAKAQSGKKGDSFSYAEEQEKFSKKNPNVKFDGNQLNYASEDYDSEKHGHIVDHGIQAFKKQMEEMRDAWHGNKEKGVAGHRADYKEESHHKAIPAYGAMDEEERSKFDKMSTDERAQHLGNKHLASEGVKDALQKYHDEANAGNDTPEARQELLSALTKAGCAVATNTDRMGLKGNAGFLSEVRKMNPSKGDNTELLAKNLGDKEISRARDEASKNFIPEGKYLIGNPLTGKQIAIHVGSDFSGGVGSKTGGFATVLNEGFDPEGGKVHDIGGGSSSSWNSLGKLLGLQGYTESGGKQKMDMDNMKAVLTSGRANSDETAPFMQKISEEEYSKMRSKTKLGMQETSKHSDFKLVNQVRDKEGNLQSNTYAMTMPDGSTNKIDVDAKGYIQDPVMARLIRQRKAITSVDDLHEVMSSAIGNRAWVTAHFGGNIHLGDALGHHVQLEYDGQGAPRVIGDSKYSDYRFMDSKDVPKGAIDPATGEPIKTMFHNGKLVDRKFTKSHDVPLAEGNDVLIPNGKGGWKKGKISKQTDTHDWLVKDSKGVPQVYKASELKNAKADGYTKSESGMATVRLAQKGVHRLDEGELSTEHQKALKQALTKAKLAHSEDNTHAFSDSQRKRLEKQLSKHKLGSDILAKLNTAHIKQLEIHVPEELREQLSHEGVAIGSSGKARISVGKFEQLREALGGLSVDHKASGYLKDHFNRKDRVPKSAEELQKDYQPSHVDQRTPFGKNYTAQFKPDSFLMNKDQGLYGVQLEGVNHMIQRGRCIVGHGMGVGKTIQGVVGALHAKATALANGEKPKKTLIVAPAGIRSDWGKEISRHTNSKAMFIGSATDRKTSEVVDGKHMWGQDGLKHEHVLAKDFIKNIGTHASEDHDFHIVSYDQFMKHRDKLSNSGMYGNIVLDEVHAFKNRGGQRGKALAETTDKFKNVWGFSGTPIENDAREVHSLIDSITGGRHELGSAKEFTDNYMIKDKNGKITGIKPDKAEKLGDILANVVQFRGGNDVSRIKADGKVDKVSFPRLEGTPPTDHDPNPRTDFVGNMVDNTRDHKTTEYYGTKHSIVDYTEGEKEATSKAGDKYKVQTFMPNTSSDSHSPQVKAFYDKYNELQSQLLPESKLQELATASAQGQTGAVGGKSNNYLTASMALQKFLNAPDAHRMYVPGATNALTSSATDAQAETPTAPKAGEATESKNHELDAQGHKRYYESDGQGGYKKNADGSPVLLPPLHHNNPKAQYLKHRVGTYLDHLSKENATRRKNGETELMPKIAIKSSYTTFGTDVIENVLRDMQREHPELRRWADKTGDKFGFGSFTGQSENREAMKSGFRGDNSGDHKNYSKDQGSLWAMTVSPAGKEGIDLGNAHAMWHYDQEYNPEKMAQFTARVRRSDSVKTHEAVGRSNSVRVESLHVPGTVEDFVFNTEDRKAENTQKVKDETRQAEQSPRYGDTASGLRTSSIGRKPAKAKAENAKPMTAPTPIAQPKPPKQGVGAGSIPKGAVAQANKALKLVILL